MEKRGVWTGFDCATRAAWRVLEKAVVCYRTFAGVFFFPVLRCSRGEARDAPSPTPSPNPHQAVTSTLCTRWMQSPRKTPCPYGVHHPTAPTAPPPPPSDGTASLPPRPPSVPSARGRGAPLPAAADASAPSMARRSARGSFGRRRRRRQRRDGDGRAAAAAAMRAAPAGAHAPYAAAVDQRGGGGCAAKEQYGGQTRRGGSPFLMSPSRFPIDGGTPAAGRGGNSSMGRSVGTA